MSFEEIKNEESVEEEKISEEELSGFRDKIQKLKEIEMQKKEDWIARGKTGEEYNPHFNDIDTKFLEKSDFELYKKYEEGIELNEFEEMKASVVKELSEIKEKDPERYNFRSVFWEYVANLIQIQQREKIRKELAKMKKEK